MYFGNKRTYLLPEDDLWISNFLVDVGVQIHIHTTTYK